MKKIILMFITLFLLTKKLYAIDNIVINNANLVPSFSKSTKIYNVFVSEDKEIITINASKEENEIVTGTGSISLKKGLNTIEIASFIDDKETSRYIINITRGENKFLEDDSSLNNIIIDGYDISFDKSIYNYEIDAKNTDERLNISYQKDNPLSKVYINGDVILKNKENIIKLEVESANKKNTTIYTIKVNKDIDKSFYVNEEKKELSDFDLKIIRIIIIFITSTLIGILFYFILIRKKPNKGLYT